MVGPFQKKIVSWGRNKRLLGFGCFSCHSLLLCGTYTVQGRCAGAAKAAQLLHFCSLICKITCLRVTLEFVPALHMRNAMQMGVLS